MNYSIIFGLALFFSLLTATRTVNIAVRVAIKDEKNIHPTAHWFQIVITAALWSIYHYMSH